MLLLRHLQGRRGCPGRMSGPRQSQIPLLGLCPNTRKTHFFPRPQKKEVLSAFFGRTDSPTESTTLTSKIATLPRELTGGAIPISSTTCIFTALSAQLVVDHPFVGRPNDFLFFFTMTSIKSIYGATAVNILQTLGPPFLRHLHRHDCIRH
ncbi:hypothetical protein N8I77_012853 [Diaporthe amygdali]|uniref:Uncharacterized protein n=1 Tax=Phomopsis amygdali TaxID=1214568 RepID=A0AAD9VX47_PHOAM|nr:hypothetical protein N8I77_012853 [Diaporthe amygdali]